MVRETEWTPRLLCLLLLLLLLLILFFILLGIILTAIFGSYSVERIILHPPICDNCKKNGFFEQTPSTLYVHYYSPSQGYIAIADHALTNTEGTHTTCFIMPLDRSALPSMEALKDALKHNEVQSEFGWQQYWQYQAEPIDASMAQRKFSSPIQDCEQAKWYLLVHTLYTKDASCSDCYDFCLPDYSIQRLHKYEDDMTIGIRRLNCFRFYVPEWSKFQIRTDSDGGRWSYPKSKSS
ncbi:unnamed protein product [Dracunculus medinensis]|uniref:BRICHOS domain-containing protein n=1 Tax=Dracunculus medinensis TaxID=318479 RepID=A0A158Q6I2_DRAME|nr:unnamed protein product [Dracunculus medinensis]